MSCTLCQPRPRTNQSSFASSFSSPLNENPLPKKNEDTGITAVILTDSLLSTEPFTEAPQILPVKSVARRIATFVKDFFYFCMNSTLS